MAVHLLEMREEVSWIDVPMASSSATQQPSLPEMANQEREQQPLWVAVALAVEVTAPQMPKQMTDRIGLDAKPSPHRDGSLPLRWPSRLHDPGQCP